MWENVSFLIDPSGLWITQINCHDGSAVQSPPGCTQFHFGSEGIIKTFNFEGVQYMGSQNYKICIRQDILKTL
jgi:hypothetical protein